MILSVIASLALSFRSQVFFFTPVMNLLSFITNDKTFPYNSSNFTSLFTSNFFYEHYQLSHVIFKIMSEFIEGKITRPNFFIG
jgi:hypothetical protein